MKKIVPGMREFLELMYAFCGKQMTVTVRAEGIPEGAFIQVSFIWPDGYRVARDRTKQRKAQEAVANGKMPSVAAATAAP